jgi:hypothetical protein
MDSRSRWIIRVELDGLGLWACGGGWKPKTGLSATLNPSGLSEPAQAVSPSSSGWPQCGEALLRGIIAANAWCSTNN